MHNIVVMVVKVVTSGLLVFPIRIIIIARIISMFVITFNNKNNINNINHVDKKCKGNTNTNQ